jgi:hypothetical protein
MVTGIGGSSEGMKDILRSRTGHAEVDTVLASLKEFLGSRAFTVEQYDNRRGCLTARKTSTLLVLLGMDRALRACVRNVGQEDGLMIELHWKGVLKGCSVSFIEAFMITLIIGRDLGLQGLLLSFLLGSVGSTLNLSSYILQRFLLRRAVRRAIWPSGG